MIWERQVHEGKPTTPIHLKNSYASETPVTDGQRVYCCFGNVGIFCFDFDGHEVWRHELAPHATRFGWGTASSPRLHEDRLYLVNDNDEDSYSAGTGREDGCGSVARVTRREEQLVDAAGVAERSAHGDRDARKRPGPFVRSRRASCCGRSTGMSSITIATPYAQDGLLYLQFRIHDRDRLRPIYAIRPGATGDISLQDGQTSNEWIAWCQTEGGAVQPLDARLPGQLVRAVRQRRPGRFNARDGAEVFGRQRIPKGGSFTASPWAYDGKVFCLNEDGVTFVLKAGSQFEVLAHQRTRGGRHVHGHAGHRGTAAADSHGRACLLHCPVVSIAAV